MIKHLRHDDARFCGRVAAGQYLPVGQAVRAPSVGLDVGDGDGFLPPGVIDQYFRVDAQFLVQSFRVGVQGHLPHGFQPQLFQAPRGAGPHAPEVGDGAVVPHGGLIALFVQDAEEVGAVLGRYIQRHLGKVQVAAQPAGGGDARVLQDGLAYSLAQLAGAAFVEAQVAGYVQEGFVDGVDVYVVFRNEAQHGLVDACRIAYVQGHARRRHDVFHALGDLEDPAAVAHALRLERGRDRKADGLVAAFRVGHHQIGC